MQNKMRPLKVNATLNAIKQCCGIIFPIVTYSYASRVVGADGLGIYSFVQSIISYMLLIASIGISNYAVREGAKIKDDSDKLKDFCNQIYSINIVFTVFSYLILFFTFILWNKLHGYKYALLIQCTAIVLTTLGADWINSIYEDYIYLTIRYIAIQIISLFLMILFVKSTDDLYRYIVICTFSSFGGNLFNFVYIRKRIKLNFVFDMKFSIHIVPLMILFFNSVASVIYLNSDITMLEIYTNDKEVGIYSVSTKIYYVLKTLINGVTYVTIPRFSYYIGHKMKEKYLSSFSILFDALVVITIPAAVGIYMLSDSILFVFAGQGYESGQKVLQILSITFPFAVASCLYSYAVLIPNSNEKYFMLSTILAAISNIVLNLFAIPKYGIVGAALTTLLAEIIVFSVSAYFSHKFIKRELQFKKYFAVIVGALIIIIICYLLSVLKLSVYLYLVLSILISCLIYAAILLIFKVSEIYMIINYIKMFVNKLKGRREENV